MSEAQLEPKAAADFAGLLKALAPPHAPAHEAERVFQNLRLRLIRFFESQACPLAEDCADETIQRVAHKFGAGLKIEAEDPYIYFRGVARFVLQEQWRRQTRWTPLEEVPPPALPTFDPVAATLLAASRQEREQQLRCLEQCLAAQPAEARELFLAYHQGGRAEVGGNIDHRAALAAQLGIDITALRNRVTRLRRKLEECVRHCAAIRNARPDTSA